MNPKSSWQAAVAPALVAILSACGDVPNTAPGQTMPVASTQFLAAQRDGFRTLSDEYRYLAQRAPGFAGVFFDSAGQLTINVATHAFSVAARQEVMAWATKYAGAGGPNVVPRIVQTQYDYLTLHSHYRPLLDLLARSAFLTSSRIDEMRARIVVTVSDLLYAPDVRRAADQVGVPVAMLDIEQLPHARPDATLRDLVRPVHGGLEIQSDFTELCTVGFDGYRTNGGYPDPSLGRYFMTAAHCQNHVGTVGTVWGQDTNTAAARIGVEVHQAPVFYYPQCPYIGNVGCRRADVAVVQYDSAVASGYGVVKKTNIGSIVITGLTGVSGDIYGALAGEKIWKVGKTTGTTTGTVLNTCVDIPPPPPPNTAGLPGILCTHTANYNSSGGDSGAPIFIPYNSANPYGTPRTVGIHGGVFGSVRYYSPMSQIWSAQGYQFYW